MDKQVLRPIPFVNYFVARGDFYRLLISFANSFDPDQDQQNAGDWVLIWIQIVWHSGSVPERIFEKCQQTTKKHVKI